MSWRVTFTKQALKQLRKLDEFASLFILSWINKNLVGTDDPRRSGKGLKGNLSGAWRYRIGDYRVIANIQDEIVTILIVQIGHRKDIYKEK